MKLNFISHVTLMLLCTIGIQAISTTIPLAPINVGAYNFREDSIRLSFKDMSSNELGFKIYHNGLVIGTVEAKDSLDTYQYYNLSGLSESTLYTIQIVSFNEVGESTPLIKSFRTTKKRNLPLGPSSSGAYNFTETTARINFLDNAINENGFRVYRGKELLITLPAKVGSGEYVYETLVNLNICDLYLLSVVAFNIEGESKSLPINFTTAGCDSITVLPKVPSDIGIYNITSNSVRVSFLDNASNEDGFIIELENEDNNNSEEIEVILPRNRYTKEYNYKTITNLLPNTLYALEVEAFNDVGDADSVIKYFRTLP